MKHVTYAEKSHFLGDEAADTLIEYATALANADIADSVTLTAIDEHGNTVDATFLLTPSAALLVATSSSDMAEPDNTAAVEQMLHRVSALVDPPSIRPEEHPEPRDDRHYLPLLA